MAGKGAAMKVYYSHCIALYDTPQEARDVSTLESLGFYVLNPNHPGVGNECALRRADGWDTQRIMDEIFRPLVLSCDALAFRSLTSGAIPAGVAKEVAWAVEAGKPVIELPALAERRRLTVEETRAYLMEIGKR